MAISNKDRVRKGLDQLNIGLIPFVERELKSKLGGFWKEEVTGRSKGIRLDGENIHWDTQAILKAMVDNWQGVFRFILGFVERSYVGELLDVRNQWAHEKPFSSDDVYRALDTMQRLLQAISAPAAAEEINTLKIDLQRQVYDEQARHKTRYQQMTLEGMPKSGLKPWREIITPHRDVASGKYMEAEFAADLAQVYQGSGSKEYLDPHEFFRRTFITVGLRDLLSGALMRMTGIGGDPVLELQTNFGGGKTHSMLALYHLFSGVETASLEGIEPVLEDAGVESALKAHRAVLVGTALSPAEISQKEDGTKVHTLWGEMAWQLGGPKGYAMVADSDKSGTSPGSKTLTKLFKTFSPCLVFIDEWVAYARQLYDKTDLPAGTFDAQGSFAQAVTEAAKAAPKTLVVASLPQSRIEIGGDHGEKSLEVLKNIFIRVAKTWRAATGDEGFEIVRRRLFEPISGKEAFASRDAVINAFSKMYRNSDRDFPRECGEGIYEDELRASYPIHPELFRRLYDDWSTLDKFQRTRGVLRLLAKVVHCLWENQDGGLLIMPASVPMDDHAIKSELTRYLHDVWEPIISQDVDGPNSMPLALDQQNANLGRYSACRRVARALYIGTAPGAESDTPGVGSERVRLACAQPGETAATFGDALRRVSEKGQYIHQDGNRYWLSTRPNLNRTADDRAAALLREPEELHAEIIKRLKQEKKRGEFTGVHICPSNSADVPDDPSTRLVILCPEYPHKKNAPDSKARKVAKEILLNRGGTPRLNQNTLIFLAPDEKGLKDLMQAVAQYLSWTSILKDKQGLNLDQFQLAQSESKIKEYDHTTNLRINSTWALAMVPYQRDPSAEISWDDVRFNSSGTLAERAGKKLVQDELLLPKMGGIRLRMELDKYLWKDRSHITVGELCEWFPRYLYLPRIKERDTLIHAVEDGAAVLLADDTFAVAEAYDQDKDRYLGLKIGNGAPAAIDNGTCLVKVAVAHRQREADLSQSAAISAQGDIKEEIQVYGGNGDNDGDATSNLPETSAPARPKSFVGSVKLDGSRVGRDAGRIADEILSHLASLSNAKVSVTMEIEINIPDGVDEKIIRIVSENATALKFEHASFEKD